MIELLSEIRRYAGIKRSDVWVRQGRNAMDVDAVMSKEAAPTAGTMQQGHTQSGTG